MQLIRKREIYNQSCGEQSVDRDEMFQLTHFQTFTFSDSHCLYAIRGNPGFNLTG